MCGRLVLPEVRGDLGEYSYQRYHSPRIAQHRFFLIGLGFFSLTEVVVGLGRAFLSLSVSVKTCRHHGAHCRRRGHTTPESILTAPTGSCVPASSSAPPARTLVLYVDLAHPPSVPCCSCAGVGGRLALWPPAARGRSPAPSPPSSQKWPWQAHAVLTLRSRLT